MPTDTTIEFGQYTASIASVGASLRQLTHRGRDLVVPFELGGVRPAYRGATLAPWPNRIVDGEYDFLGDHFQLEISEPERHHALHGLVAWADFSVRSTTSSSVTLSTSIAPQTGYPHSVDVEVTYLVDEGGLHETVRGRNVGETAAPFGFGPHPYLVAGPGRVDDWMLWLRADSVLAVDDRLAPLALVPVDDPAHGDFDYRRPRILGAKFIDHAFTDLEFTAGHTGIELTGADGRGVGMTWDERCRWVQIHTADSPAQDLDRLGLAVEPMTCPPDAFNSGIDLLVLEPRETTTASWTIRSIGP